MTTIQGNTQPTKENPAWNALCDLTTELFPQFGSRSVAFAAACAQRPDLAALAIDPTGAPVVKVASQGTGQAPLATPAAADPLTRAVEKACEASAARMRSPTEAPGAPASGDALTRAIQRLGGQ